MPISQTYDAVPRLYSPLCRTDKVYFCSDYQAFWDPANHFFGIYYQHPPSGERNLFQLPPQNAEHMQIPANRLAGSRCAKSNRVTPIAAVQEKQVESSSARAASPSKNTSGRPGFSIWRRIQHPAPVRKLFRMLLRNGTPKDDGVLELIMNKVQDADACRGKPRLCETGLQDVALSGHERGNGPRARTNAEPPTVVILISGL